AILHWYAGGCLPSERKIKRNGTNSSARLPARFHDGGLTSRIGRPLREVGLPFACFAWLCFGFSFVAGAGSIAHSSPFSSYWTNSHSWRWSFSRRRRCFLEGMALP